MRRPCRWASGTATGAATKLPTLNATAVSPAFSGEKCSAGLQPQREGEEEALHPGEEGELHAQPGGERRHPEQLGPQQRRHGTAPDCRASNRPSATSPATPAAISGHTQAGQPS